MKEFWNNLKQKIYGCSCFQKGGCLCLDTNSEDITRTRVPFFKICFGPFSLLLDNGKNFFLLAIPYAAVMTILAMLLGFGYMCLYSKTVEVNAYCSESGLLYLLYSLIKLSLVIMFALKWVQSGLLRIPLTLKNFIKFDCRFIHLLGALLIVILLNVFPLISSLILYARVPNPDWRIEIVFFAIVSIGFVIPFLAIRFYSALAFISCGCKVPSLKIMWLKNTGNTMNLLASLFIIFVLAMFILGNLHNNFGNVAAVSNFYINFMSEFIYNIIFMIVVALFFNHCFIQKQILYSEEEKEKSNEK